MKSTKVYILMGTLEVGLDQLEAEKEEGSSGSGAGEAVLSRAEEEELIVSWMSEIAAQIDGMMVQEILELQEETVAVSGAHGSEARSSSLK